MSILSCQVCDLPLDRQDERYLCAQGHSFDLAREGYVNLLLSGQKASRDPGDSRDMVRSRRAFLEAGHYAPLADRVAGLVRRHLPGRHAHILDAGCGEGYFLRRLRERLPSGASLWGIDISRWAVRMAAKASRDEGFAVASVHRLPVQPGIVDIVLTVLSPRDFEQWRRILAPGAHLVVVVPGPGHLFGLRQLVYRSPVPHEAESKLDGGPGFEAISEETVAHPLQLDRTALAHLVSMTPYLWHLDDQSRATLAATDGLRTEAEFAIRVLRRTPQVPQAEGPAPLGAGAEP
jgi:23S rRNA (guanine745-N1)-methyltransferase